MSIVLLLSLSFFSFFPFLFFFSFFFFNLSERTCMYRQTQQGTTPPAQESVLDQTALFPWPLDKKAISSSFWGTHLMRASKGLIRRLLAMSAFAYRLFLYIFLLSNLPLPFYPPSISFLLFTLLPLCFSFSPVLPKQAFLMH